MTRYAMRRGGLAMASVLVLALPVLGFSPASVEKEAALDVGLGSASFTTEADGTPLNFSSLVDEDELSTASGYTSSGDPFVIEANFAEPIEDLTVSNDDAAEPELSQQGEPVEGVDYSLTDEPIVEYEYATTDSSGHSSSPLAPVITVAMTPSTASVVWAAVPGAQTYSVSLQDGTPVVADGTAAAVEGLSEGYSDSFTIVAAGAEGTPLLSRTVPISAPAVDSYAIAPLAHQPYTTGFTMEAFLPQNLIPAEFPVDIACDVVGETGSEFGGDNRSFKTPNAAWPYDNPDYRVMVMAVANWNNPANSRLLLGKGVQPTKLYRNGVLQETRTASPDGLQVSFQTSSTSMVHVRWNGTSANPFCFGSAIHFDLGVRIYRNGTIETYGSHRPAPSYEMYVQWNNTGQAFWRTLLRRDTASLTCLVPGACAERSLVTTGSS